MDLDKLIRHYEMLHNQRFDCIYSYEWDNDNDDYFIKLVMFRRNIWDNEYVILLFRLGYIIYSNEFDCPLQCKKHYDFIKKELRKDL